jgi:cell division septation protein DedD
VKPAKAETPAKAQSPAKSDAPAKVETPAKVAAPAKADAPAKLDTPAQSDASAKVESAAKADAPTKGWFVQIGVFAEEERAKGLQDRLREKGISLQTDTIQGPRGKFTRLRAGPFVDREPASALLARIKGLGENAILVHQ